MRETALYDTVAHGPSTASRLTLDADFAVVEDDAFAWNPPPSSSEERTLFGLRAFDCLSGAPFATSH